MFHENLLNKSLRLFLCYSLTWIALFSSVLLANPVRFTSSDSGEIAENETSTILVVEAVADESPADEIVSITLVPGEDEALFSLVNLVMPSPSAGTPAQAELSFQSARNFEDPVDEGGTAGDNIYRVTVRATDSNGDFIDQRVSVTVNNENETPTAVDDHYTDFPDLIIDEDSGELIFNVTANDILGDAPTEVVSAGVTITNSLGMEESWRTTTRLVDRTNTGDSIIEANGEVSCANQSGCQDGETSDTSIDASGILESQIMYKPRADFFGEDQFLYCIQDSVATGEPVFSKEASDSRCATVTIQVNPVNDLPQVSGDIIYAMNQADDLIVPVEEGLSNFVASVDYTHIDGQGCNPSDADCTPDENVEELFFSFQSATTTNGVLLPPFETDGSFK